MKSTVRRLLLSSGQVEQEQTGYHRQILILDKNNTSHQLNFIAREIRFFAKLNRQQFLLYLLPSCLYYCGILFSYHY